MRRVCKSVGVIGAARAETLKLANQREAAVPDAPVLVRGAVPFDLAAARALADPALDLATPLKGPFRAERIDWRGGAVAALELARIVNTDDSFALGVLALDLHVELPTDLVETDPRSFVLRKDAVCAMRGGLIDRYSQN